MTTIAYRDGVMAADSKVGCGTTVRGEIQKLYRVNGNVIGFSGALGTGLRFLRWVEAGMPDDRPSLPHDDGFRGLLARSDGVCLTFDSDLMAQQIDAPFHACGSGVEIALGAMAAGASAEEAVKIAAQYDVYTGGTIRVERV